MVVNGNVFGWIVPGSHKFVACGVYVHLKEETLAQINLKNVPGLDEELKRWRAFDEEFTESRQDMGMWESHWHLHDMASDDHVDALWEIIMKSNLIRVGSSREAIH